MGSVLVSLKYRFDKIVPEPLRDMPLWTGTLIIAVFSAVGTAFLGYKILALPLAFVILFSILRFRIFPLLFYFTIAEFMFHLSTKFVIPYQFTFSILIILLALFKGMLGFEEKTPLSRTLVILFLIIICLTIISDLNSGLSSKAIKMLIRYLIFFPFLYAIYYIVRPKDYIPLFIAMTIPVVGASIYMLSIYSGAETPIALLDLYRMKPGGIFGNSNSLGAMTMLLLPFWVAQGFHQQRKKYKVVSTVISLILLLGLILSNSRAAMFGFFVAMLVFSVLSKRILKMVVVCLVFVLILLAIPLVRQLVGVGLRMERGTSTRTEIWANTIKIIESNIWLGIGPGNYPDEYMNYYSLSIKKKVYGITPHAHNFLLDVTSRLGIGGLIIGLLLYVLPIREGVRAARTALDEDNRWIIYGIIGGITALYVFTIFEGGWLLGDGRSYGDVVFWLFYIMLIKINVTFKYPVKGMFYSLAK